MATAQVLQPRPLRGSRISSFYPVKSLPSLSSLDSAFQLQEYISLLIRLDVHDVDTITKLPSTEGSTVDESCWIYEQLRRLAQDLSHPLITMLQTECTRHSCPEMKAGEWLYLCVAHGNDGAMERCCAIDYILHTLDSATALLNSPRAFPSRLQIPPSSRRHFSSLARRLGRIFAHAYFHHRELFEQAEAESSLYKRFLRLVEGNGLVPAEFLVIPTTGSSLDSRGAPTNQQGGDVPPPKLYGAALNPSSDEQNPYLIPSLSSTDDPSSAPPAAATEGTTTESSSPPRSGSSSPRKPTGRSRTDTMVYSDYASALEDLSSSGGNSSFVKAVTTPEEPVNPIDSARKAVLELDIVPASTAPPPPPSSASPGTAEPTSATELLKEESAVDLGNGNGEESEASADIELEQKGIDEVESAAVPAISGTEPGSVVPVNSEGLPAPAPAAPDAETSAPSAPADDEKVEEELKEAGKETVAEPEAATPESETDEAPKPNEEPVEQPEESPAEEKEKVDADADAKSAVVSEPALSQEESKGGDENPPAEDKLEEKGDQAEKTE